MESDGTVPECAHAMSDTVIEASTLRKDTHPCDWCGKPASFKCSRCEFVHLCSKECQKKLQKTHKYICGRVTPVLTNPNVSPFYGVGDPAWDAAHRGLRGEYYIDAADGKKVKMQSQYAPGEDRPDLFLVLPAPERQRVVEYLDVQSLCRMEQVMQNVYSLLAWYEALRGAWIPSVSAWPRYTSAGKFAGLRWSMNRRVELRGVKIWRVFVEGEGAIGDEWKIFFKLCEKKSWTDIACMLVESGSMDPNSTLEYGVEPSLLLIASYRGCLDVVDTLIEAGADIAAKDEEGKTALDMAKESDAFTPEDGGGMVERRAQCAALLEN